MRHALVFFSPLPNSLYNKKHTKKTGIIKKKVTTKKIYINQLVYVPL